MAPAAVATIHQFASPLKANNKSSHPSSEWNNMGETALDFDLLAEYLLEDMGAGGFDFGASLVDAVGPPTINAPTGALPDPGVVTPNPNPGNSETPFFDPLHEVAARLPHPPRTLPASGGIAPPVPRTLPAGGDLSGELSQVQRMIASTASSQRPQATSIVVPRPPPARIGTGGIRTARPPTTRPAVPRAPPQRPRQPAATVTATATRPRAPVPNGAATATRAQPHKRARVGVAPVAKRIGAAPIAKKGGYSFASAAAAAAAAAGGGAKVGPPRTDSPAGGPDPGARGGRHGKSQAQIDRRRERNRILARRTRLRKKFFFESLQKDVADLQRENAALKSIVRSRLAPDVAGGILAGCDACGRLPRAAGPDGEGEELGADARELDGADFGLIRSIQNSQQCFIITDPSLHDNPVVYASDDFLTLTGYSQEEVLGRNCRFLQGTETCQEKVAEVRRAVKAGEDVNVTFANYTSDGTPFWNSLFIAALRDAENNIVNFIGVIVKVAGPEPGDSEYGKVLK